MTGLAFTEIIFRN